MLMQTELRTVSVSRKNAIPRPARGGFGAMEAMGSQMRFGPNEEIFGDGEPAEYVYKVIKGAVRTYKILCDGRRQIGGFYLPGDIFGLEIDKEHQFSAEAIKDVTVLIVRRSAIISLAERDCDAARELWSFTGRELNRVQEHLLLLVKSAQQRVASFLLEMSARLSAADAIELPMSRQDIADYLGLTIETVSRTMTQLASEQAIGLPSARRIVLRNSSVEFAIARSRAIMNNATLLPADQGYPSEDRAHHTGRFEALSLIVISVYRTPGPNLQQWAIMKRVVLAALLLNMTWPTWPGQAADI